MLQGDGCSFCRAPAQKQKLLVARCGHKFCTLCLDTKTFEPCPVCKMPISRSEINAPDSELQKEIRIRKQLAVDFNLSESDFASLREYNDYLEQVEDLVDQRMRGVDVATQLTQHRERYREQIRANADAKARREREIVQQIANERREMEERRLAIIEAERLEAALKLKQKEDAIASLEKGAAQAAQQQTPATSGSAPMGASKSAESAAHMVYVPAAPTSGTGILGGGAPPPMTGLVQPIGAAPRTATAPIPKEMLPLHYRASGFDPKLPLRRAEQEAFSSTFLL
ncbi:putative CDK-activating kinase assembly factor MAT1 [Paratrimastix pyriformis]|uniref:CDK-activating kinase assembly factor MAT1 n=1 Tax=Paratrimastix pyriformis TaxID=342808 RepID=A0ABQ8UAD6_9EUKA|nr:putative CDK-activating kinase assembly factor MAT1 [Paratrimastix pyriformis]